MKNYPQIDELITQMAQELGCDRNRMAYEAFAIDAKELIDNEDFDCQTEEQARIELAKRGPHIINLYMEGLDGEDWLSQDYLPADINLNVVREFYTFVVNEEKK
ncbi:hypothetical protein [Piscirickettsia litoralis]|uniref:Uncharacterized protein n=1 Tax=Piscirickettsia litoralis TaxID=1891921 RepID=A0ABX3A746_9GAMM|nr:hypothetical protein [Piscirickettsia litoralis]ODN41924.1 hypothetical protein BGC07_01785 [Piscirickettsia litoralis]